MSEISDETPPGVLGYVVAHVASKVSLTHSSVMDRESAEKEAAMWRRSGGGAFGRYVVCEVREVTG
jgi:hypothetical protein